MAVLYLVEQGTKVSIESRRLIVSKRDEGSEKSCVLQKVPLVKVDAVVVFGNISFTTPALKRLMNLGKDVVFLTVHGRYCGRVVGPPSRFGQLRHQQYNRLNDTAFALDIGRRVVEAKLANMRTLLLRYNRALGDTEIAAVTDKLAALRQRASHTQTLNALMGVEGKGSALYFGVFKKLFKHDWPFHKRVRRPPRDPINVLLSFGYTLLTRQMEAMVNLVGLDPYLGFLHQPSYGRPSLALDLVEEFRPIVTDSVVLRVCNEGLITPDNFSAGDDPARPVVLDEAGCKRFLQEFEARLAIRFKHPDSQERVTYRRVFELQVRRLATSIQKGVAYRPFLVR